MEKVRVYWEYRYLKTIGLVKMFFINGIPFTWDELEEDPSFEIVKEARERYMFTQDDVYHGSMYLLEEGFHPLIDEIDYDELSELPT